MTLRQSVGSVLIAALAVAVVASASIYALSRWAHERHATELQLVQLQCALNAMDALEWRAISQGRVTEELEQRMAEESATVGRLLSSLAQQRDMQSVWLLNQHYAQAMTQEFELIRQGDVYGAIAQDATLVDPAFSALTQAIGAASFRSGAAARQAQRYAEVGMAGSLLLAAGLVGGLFVSFTRSRAKQARMLAQTLSELHQAQDQLVHAGKLAALGQLVAGIAHELNTPLGAIRAAAGNAMAALQGALAALPELGSRLDIQAQQALFAWVQVLPRAAGPESTAERRVHRRHLMAQLEQLQIPDARRLADVLVDIGLRGPLTPALPLLHHPQRDWLLALVYDLTRLRGNSAIILDAVERTSKVVMALKNYARVEHSQDRHPVDLRASLQGVLDLYGTQVRQGIEVERSLAPTPAILGHADELVQVWTNLIHNALQAMGGQGVLGLRTAVEADHVVVSVTDSGPGVPEELQARIFEPFFSTKPRGEGTGLGLHICQKIVQQHGGSISLESVPGRTTFTVRLPLATVSSEAVMTPSELVTDAAPSSAEAIR